MALRFVSENSIGKITREAAARAWELLRDYSIFDKAELKCYKTLTRKVHKIIPRSRCSWRVMDIHDNQRIITGEGPVYPSGMYSDRRRYKLVEVWNRITVKDMVKYHMTLHQEAGLDTCQDQTP